MVVRVSNAADSQWNVGRICGHLLHRQWLYPSDLFGFQQATATVKDPMSAGNLFAAWSSGPKLNDHPAVFSRPGGSYFGRMPSFFLSYRGKTSSYLKNYENNSSSSYSNFDPNLIKRLHAHS